MKSTINTIETYFYFIHDHFIVKVKLEFI